MKLFNPVTKVAGLIVSEANVHSSNEDFPFIISITVSESDRQAPINCPKTSSQKSPCYFKVKVVKNSERTFLQEDDKNAIRDRGVDENRTIALQPEFITNFYQMHREQEYIQPPELDEHQLDYLITKICESMDFNQKLRLHTSKTMQF
jgi:hypothetical protein